MHEEKTRSREKGRTTFSNAPKIKVEQCITTADMTEWKKNSHVGPRQCKTNNSNNFTDKT